MSQSRRGEVRDNTVPIVLVALIVVLFLRTASFHRQLDAMETRLMAQLDRVEQQLSAQITRVGRAGGDQ